MMITSEIYIVMLLVATPIWSNFLGDDQNNEDLLRQQNSTQKNNASLFASPSFTISDTTLFQKTKTDAVLKTKNNIDGKQSNHLVTTSFSDDAQHTAGVLNNSGAKKRIVVTPILEITKITYAPKLRLPKNVNSTHLLEHNIVSTVPRNEIVTSTSLFSSLMPENDVLTRLKTAGYSESHRKSQVSSIVYSTNIVVNKSFSLKLYKTIMFAPSSSPISTPSLPISTMAFVNEKKEFSLNTYVSFGMASSINSYIQYNTESASVSKLFWQPIFSASKSIRSFSQYRSSKGAKKFFTTKITPSLSSTHQANPTTIHLSHERKTESTLVITHHASSLNVLPTVSASMTSSMKLLSANSEMKSLTPSELFTMKVISSMTSTNNMISDETMTSHLTVLSSIIPSSISAIATSKIMPSSSLTASHSKSLLTTDTVLEPVMKHSSVGSVISSVPTSVTPLLNLATSSYSLAMKMTSVEIDITKSVMPSTSIFTTPITPPTTTAAKWNITTTNGNTRNSTQSTTNVNTTVATTTTTEEPFTNKPNEKNLPSLFEGSTGNTIKVYIHIPYSNSKVKLLHILVQEYKKGVSDSTAISTWFDVNNRPAHRYRRYRALEIPQIEKSVKDLYNNERKRKNRDVSTGKNGMYLSLIGLDLRCDTEPKFICNGPLKTGTSYRFQVEAELFNKSIYRSQFTEAHTTYKEKKINTHVNGPNSTILIILSVLLVCFILLSLAIIIFVCRRRQRGRSLQSDSTDDIRSALMNTCDKASKNSRRKFSGPDILMERRKSIKGMTRPVSVRDFRAWVQRSSSDSDFRFAEEFESMREVGKFERHEIADMPENRGKNRYVNVLAYDYTRVKLSSIDDEPGSDYVNANYVHGYKHPRAYIATQGPLPSTTDDFWRMTWEQNSRIIVMVTQCMERGRVKCHQYWPTTESTRYSEIVVTQLSEYEASEWIEREFSLEYEGETRHLRHYQFIAWPDHGVPKSTSAMLDFIHIIRLQQQPEDGPLICHCSAGVGRTGTYLCLDILMNKLQYEYNVDVYGVVCLMRTQRCSMVQTEDQYIYIHRVILQYLQQKEEKEQIFSTLTRPKNGETPVFSTGDDDSSTCDAISDDDEFLNEKLIEKDDLLGELDNELHNSQNEICETAT